MATIQHLNTSIIHMSLDILYGKLRDIRANRRVRPTKKLRAKTAPKRTKIPKDPFALITTMSPGQKAILAEALLQNKK